MPEDSHDPRLLRANSFSNSYEVEMIAGLIEYLINTNEYDYRDITVLTPYNGQLAAFAQRLSGTCSLWLSEKDRESLILEGLIEPEDVSMGTKTDVGIASMLRLATIDDFQGEESKVVVLSTVRSNFESRVGFLKTSNRINVGCSRAKNGFFIVGNATLMSGVEMWSQIVGELTAKNKVGPAFQACCSRHPNQVHAIQRPEQWYEIPQCEIPCRSKFPCGHPCTLKCHAPALHDRIVCLEPCPKHHKTCGHQCSKICGVPCGDCTFELSAVKLPCGHEVMRTCGETRSDSEIACNVLMEPIQLECGHSRQPQCTAKGGRLRCVDMCNKLLECGHHCKGNCQTCRIEKEHTQCTSTCGNQLKCGHRCAATCHSGRSCPPCQLPCLRSCIHGGCSKECNRICDPCVRPCGWTCPHMGPCTTMCSLLCNRLPCSEPCTLKLPCGHLCPSLCGERCMTRCLECATNEMPRKTLMFLTCGHHFELGYLDAQIGLSTVYRMDNLGRIRKVVCTSSQQAKRMNPSCPECGESCKDARRYAICEQLLALQGNIDRIYAKFNRKLNMFMNKMYEAKAGLDKSYEEFSQSLRPGPLTGRTNADIIRHRGNTLAEIQRDISQFKGKGDPSPSCDPN